MSTANVKKVVREKYGQAALRVTSGTGNPCCRDSPSTLEGSSDPITSNLYDTVQEREVPDTAIKASLGCGNPTALAELKSGEIVLDLGSGGGIDVLLSARRVGPTGKAYGLDMTDEMLALAEENKRKSGLTNVEFLKGEMESIPLPDNSVDLKCTARDGMNIEEPGLDTYKVGTVEAPSGGAVNMHTIEGQVAVITGAAGGESGRFWGGLETAADAGADGKANRFIIAIPRGNSLTNDSPPGIS